MSSDNNPSEESDHSYRPGNESSLPRNASLTTDYVQRSQSGGNITPSQIMRVDSQGGAALNKMQMIQLAMKDPKALVQ